MRRNAAVTLLSKHLDTRHVDMFVSSVDKTCNMCRKAGLALLTFMHSIYTYLSTF